MTRYLGRSLAPALLGIIGLAGGCYDAGNPENCVGLSCPSGFQWNYGGEVRSWYIERPDGSDLRRFLAVFQERVNRDPIVPNVGRCFPDPNAVMGQAEDRSYIDMGSEVTFKTEDSEFEVPRLTSDEMGMPIVDFYGREHEIAYMLETEEPTSDEYFNTQHSVDFGQELPFQLRNPETGEFETVEELGGLYMPPKLNVLTPESRSAVMKKGEDFLVEWEEAEPPSPDFFRSATIVIVPDGPNVRPTTCVIGNTGRFEIPAEVIDNLEADSGIMLVGTSALPAKLRDDDAMFHMFGINCVLVPWSRIE